MVVPLVMEVKPYLCCIAVDCIAVDCLTSHVFDVTWNSALAIMVVRLGYEPPGHDASCFAMSSQTFALARHPAATGIIRFAYWFSCCD